MMHTSRRTESVFFVIQMVDDMVVLPATTEGTVEADKWTRSC